MSKSFSVGDMMVRYTEKKKVPYGTNRGFVLATKLKKGFVDGTEP